MAHYDNSVGGGGGGGTPSQAAQIIETGRNGSRTLGDYLRSAGNVLMTAARGIPCLRSGTIRSLFWQGATTGGDPIGLRLSVVRAGSEVGSQTVDCPSSATRAVVNLSSGLAIQRGDDLVVQIVSASSGTATTVTNCTLSLEVET